MSEMKKNRDYRFKRPRGEGKRPAYWGEKTKGEKKMRYVKLKSPVPFYGFRIFIAIIQFLINLPIAIFNWIMRKIKHDT